MKLIPTVVLLTIVLPSLALSQERGVKVVKGSPTNYGVNGFDISWIRQFDAEVLLGRPHFSER